MKQVRLGLALAFSLVAMRSTVRAEDIWQSMHTILPGTTCTPMPGSSVSYVYASIGNTSTTADLGVQCPVVLPQNAQISAWVTVLDTSSAQNVACTLWNYYWSNSSFGWAGTFASGNTTGSSVSNSKRIALAADSNGLNITGASFIGCSIPKKTAGGDVSQLISYDVSTIAGIEETPRY